MHQPCATTGYKPSVVKKMYNRASGNGAAAGAGAGSAQAPGVRFEDGLRPGMVSTAGAGGESSGWSKPRPDTPRYGGRKAAREALSDYYGLGRNHPWSRSGNMRGVAGSDVDSLDSSSTRSVDSSADALCNGIKGMSTGKKVAAGVGAAAVVAGTAYGALSARYGSADPSKWGSGSVGKK